jgi:KilA-N domain./Protein of unknown function (DUF3627).
MWYYVSESARGEKYPSSYYIHGNQYDIISGTYLPKELFLDIACWVSPEFYMKCSKIIEEYFVNEFKVKYQHENEALMVKLQDLGTRNEKLENYVEDISSKVVNPNKRHMFAIIQKNQSTEYPHYIIRTQRRRFPQSLKRLQKKHPKARVVADLEYNPNSISLFNRIKDEIPYITCKYNDFKLVNTPIEM